MQVDTAAAQCLISLGMWQGSVAQPRSVVSSSNRLDRKHIYTCSAFKFPQSDSMILCVVLISFGNFVESSTVG